jgi:serine/threonine protein kinase
MSGAGPKSVLNGRYRVGPSAGRWAYGEAALAADEWTYKTVVLKRVSPDLHGGAGGLAGLKAWVEKLRAVKHAALPVIEDAFEDDGKLLLVQERLEGDTLNAFLNTGSQIQLPSALVFLCQIAAGLDDAHSAGLIHGNLRPGNILITRTGRAKLLDFGLGLALRRASPSAGGVIPEGTA